jgi:protein-L-isoaspartate(D-aspartate) O-methyltransferase
MAKKELLNSLERNGFSKGTINAFSKIKREDFLPKDEVHMAYEDIPLPIGYYQTISQPYTIAFMLDLLELKHNISILEIGSGSGYVLALLNEISKNSKIYGIERIKELYNSSNVLLKDNKNIMILKRDGSKGLDAYSPYDRIIVSAAFEYVPYHLLKQLKIGGIIVAPVKNSIFKITRLANKNKTEEYPGFSFVPIISDELL